MKRVGNLIEKIAELDNLALAAHKAFRGKNRSTEVINYRKNFWENLMVLRSQVLGGTVYVGNYNRFVIFEPKERLICAAPLSQRILHHAIMNVCHEYFDRMLIYDCYASRPRKGLHKAVERTKSLAMHYRYFVKLDFRKYFDSINHSVLKDKLRDMIKDEGLINILFKIIDSYGVDGAGVPIGNLTSQYFANYYLSDLDHMMKEIVKCKVYIRYMDDVIIMGKSKDEIRDRIKKYREYALENLKLHVKPPIVGLTNNGIPFLGYKIYPGRILLGGKAKRRYKKNLNKLNKLFGNGKISETEYAMRLSSSFAFVDFADSKKYRKIIGLNVSRAPIG